MPSLKKLNLKHLHSFFFAPKQAFTLVELIVVISVLGVLATIAMTQVSNITAGARDSQRMTDMSSMKSSIELYKAKTGKLPTPTNGSGVTYSGGLLWIQGTFGESVTREIKSITPKPIDPINKIEYVYSIANNNREFELGGILEKATGYIPNLFPELHAASQNTTFIEGTYNGISLKVETGSKTYIVAAPSIVASTLGTTIETTLLSIDGLGSLPQGFSGTTTSTAQTGTFTPIIAWSGTKLPDTSTGAEVMIQGLQNAYSGSIATSLSQISSLVSATGSQTTALGQGLIQNSLGGTAITLPTQTTTNYPYSWTGTTWSACSLSCGGGAQTRTVTCQNNSGATVADSYCTEAKPATSQSCNTQSCSFFSGAGTAGDPWKKYDGTALISCQGYNTSATMTNNNTTRGAGTCGNGSQACLSDGVYLVNPSGTTFSVYCDMSVSSGGWTLVMRGNSASLPSQATWETVNDLNTTNALSIGQTFRFSLDKIRALRNGGIWRAIGDGQMNNIKWYTKGDCDLTGVGVVNDVAKCGATTDITFATGLRGKEISHPSGLGGYWSNSPWACNGLMPNFSTEIWNVCRDQTTNPGDWGCAGIGSNSTNCNFSLWVR